MYDYVWSMIQLRSGVEDYVRSLNYDILFFSMMRMMIVVVLPCVFMSVAPIMVVPVFVNMFTVTFAMTANLVSTDTTFMSSESTFMSSKTSLMPAESSFVDTFMSSKSAFMSDEATFVSAKTTFVSTETTFVASESTFMSAKSTFMSAKSSFMVTTKAATSEVSLLSRLFSSFNGILSCSVDVLFLTVMLSLAYF